MLASVRGLLLAGITVSVAGAAVASPSPSAVVVAPFDCATPPLSLPAFVEALRVELAGASIACCEARGPGVDTTQPLRVALVFNACRPTATHATVVIDEGAGGRRDVTLADIGPAARPRALALAVAELVRPVPAATTPDRVPAPPVVDAVPAVPIPPGDPRPDVAVSFGADALVRAHPARDTVMGGARGWLAGRLGDWQLEGAIDGATGRHSYPPGTVGVSALGIGATLSRRWVPGAVAVAVGLGADVEVVWITGRAEDPEVATGSGAGFTGAVRARLAVEGRALGALRPRFLVDGGLMLAPVDAYVDGARAAGTSGWFVIGAVGIAISLAGN